MYKLSVILCCVHMRVMPKSRNVFQPEGHTIVFVLTIRFDKRRFLHGFVYYSNLNKY